MRVRLRSEAKPDPLAFRETAGSVGACSDRWKGPTDRWSCVVHGSDRDEIGCGPFERHNLRWSNSNNPVERVLKGIWKSTLSQGHAKGVEAARLDVERRHSSKPLSPHPATKERTCDIHIYIYIYRCNIN